MAILQRIPDPAQEVHDAAIASDVAKAQALCARYTQAAQSSRVPYVYPDTPMPHARQTDHTHFFQGLHKPPRRVWKRKPWRKARWSDE